MKTYKGYRNVILLIKGGAYGSFKSRGDEKARDNWRNSIIAATAALPKLSGPCALHLYFALPSDRFPKDFPYGSDLDNLTDLVFDAIGETVFSNVPGKDSCVLSLSAMKMKAERDDEVGLYLSIEPLSSHIHFSFGPHRFPECLRRVKSVRVIKWREHKLQGRGIQVGRHVA